MKHFTLIITLLIATLLSGSALAQGKGVRGPDRAAKVRAKMLRKKIGLDERKAGKVEAIVRQSRKEQRQLTREIRQARRELGRLFKADSNDDAAYQAAIAKLRASNKKLQALRDKQFEQLGQVLTPREQARLLYALHKMRKNYGKARKRNKARRKHEKRNKRDKRNRRRGRPGKRPFDRGF